MKPQQIEALKLALEALELVNIEFICRNGSHHKKEDRHEWDEDCPITVRWRKAITALEEALAEHAMREVQRLGQEIEQEPVPGVVIRDGLPTLLKESEIKPTDARLFTHSQRTEQNFCPRCGKRTKDIHTCTPPRENT